MPISGFTLGFARENQRLAGSAHGCKQRDRDSAPSHWVHTTCWAVWGRQEKRSLCGTKEKYCQEEKPLQGLLHCYIQETKQTASERPCHSLQGLVPACWHKGGTFLSATGQWLHWQLSSFSCLPDMQTNGWIPFKLTWYQGNVYRSINLLTAWSWISNSLMKVAGCLHEGLSWWAKVSGPRLWRRSWSVVWLHSFTLVYAVTSKSLKALHLSYQLD